MAVPKKKNSVSRKGLRRAGQHHKLYRKHPFNCKNCGALTMPHHVCPSCGTYKGVQVLKIKTAATEEAAQA
jgi:large subunit ribosomal protein L32